MSNVIAYRCDKCNAIKDGEEIVGIVLIEDAFEKLNSYPTHLNPAGCSCHYCIECYNNDVVLPAQRLINRAKDPEDFLYKAKLKELGFSLRDSCARAVLNAKKR